MSREDRDNHASHQRKGVSPITTIVMSIMIAGATFGIAQISVYIAAIFGVATSLIGVGVVTFYTLYKKATPAEAIIRTGSGGPKVALNGGILVIPVLHEVRRVKMTTMKIDVNRKDRQSLLTKDMIRTNVIATFFVRVMRDEESIKKAAQSFGESVNNQSDISALLQDKLDGAMRAASSKSDLDELQSDREGFAGRIQEAIAVDLGKNGIEIETVTITELSQAAKEFFDEGSALDAIGLANIAKRTAEKRLERTKIENENAVAVAESGRDSAKRQLTIAQETETAQQAQRSALAEQRTQTEASIAQKEQGARLAAASATTDADKGISLAKTAAKQAEAEAEAKGDAAARTAKEESERLVGQAAVTREAGIKTEKLKREVEVAQVEEQRAAASAKAAKAKEEATVAEQAVITAEATATAERTGKVAVINARAKAESDSVGIAAEAGQKLRAAKDLAEAKTVEAEAEANAVKTAAAAKAAAAKSEAEGRASAILTEATARAEGDLKMADAIKAIGEAKATAVKAEAEAMKLIGEPQLKLELGRLQIAATTELIKALPNIMTSMMEPLKNAKDFRIVNFGGVMPGGAGFGNGQDGASVVPGPGADNSVPGQIFAALRNQAMYKPFMDLIAGAVNGDLSSASTFLGKTLTGKDEAMPIGAIAASDTAKVASGANGASRERPRAQ